MEKKGVSPIIATILLIAIVIVIAIIIFLWASHLIKESVMKNNENAVQVCDKIDMDVSLIDEETLSVTNNGNIPIYSLSLKLISGGTTTLDKISEINLAPGAYDEYTITGAYETIEVYPVILGIAGGVNKEYICDSEISKREV